jgi:hypothetical protein
MWFSAAGVPWEMVPPPGHLWPELFRLLWRETRFDPPNRTHWWQRRARRPAFPECPAAGTLTVRFANIPVEFDIIFFRGPTGEHILLRKVSAVNVSPAVADFFSSHVNKR